MGENKWHSKAKLFSMPLVVVVVVVCSLKMNFYKGQFLSSSDLGPFPRGQTASVTSDVTPQSKAALLLEVILISAANPK